MSIFLLNAGVLTTVQDRGRMGHQRYGFHASGAMDKHAFKIANALLGNDPNAAMLEFAIMGPEIRFERDTVIALTGADFAPTLNGEPIPMYRAVQCYENDVLKLNFSKDGVWGYLGLAGGVDVPLVMSSRSTDMKSEIGGFLGRKLLTEDRVELMKLVPRIPNMEKRVATQPTFKRDITKIRVVMGPQDDYFTEEGIHNFLSQEYTITPDCDRMGYKVNGSIPLEHNEKGADIISDGIAYGSIQVPAQGQLIVLLADRQTTGGYTKIATLASCDIPEFVQRRPGDKIQFVAVTPEEAQQAYLAETREIEALRDKFDPQSKGLIKLFKKLFSK